MKFYKYCIGLLLCIVIAVNPIESELLDKETELNVLNAALPAMAGLVGMMVTAVPVGPICVAALGLIHVATMIIAGGGGDDDQSQRLLHLDIMKSQDVIVGAIDKLGDRMVEESHRVLRELSYLIEAHALMEDMRTVLGSLHRIFLEKMKVIMNPKITGVQKNSTIASMLNYDSPYMEKLRSFMDKFVKPILLLPTSAGHKLFFELILQKDHLLSLENEDAYTDSMHSKVFKAFMFISKVLTDGYVMPIVAHAMQYQSEVKSGLISDSQATKSNAEELINSYKNDMKTLVEKAQWALSAAPRIIKNSGTFTPKQGETFERIIFTQMIPRVMHASTYGCNEDDGVFSLRDFETGNCHSYGDVLRPNTKISIYHKIQGNDLDRPYQYMRAELPEGDEVIFGHNSSDSSLVEQQATISDQCPTVFCPAFKKNAFAISTQRVRADREYVITGVKFRVENGVLYVDIQQGKFIDVLSVDPATVRWKQTPPGGPVTYLTSTVRKIELGEFNVEPDEYLTGIQLRPGNSRYGTFNIYVEGSKAPNWYSFGPIGSTDMIPDSNEISLGNEADDPEEVGDNVKNLISRNPTEDQGRAFIKVQPSGMKKDFGRTTCPLIDMRKVVSNPPAPLIGVKVHHIAAKKSCGFLSLGLITPPLNRLVKYELFEKFTMKID